MKFHIIGLPHTEVTDKYGQCAFTQNTLNFCKMMKGEDITLYAPGETQAPVTEFVSVYSKAQQDEWFKDEEWYRENRVYEVSWDHKKPYWEYFNARVIEELKKRVKPHDFILIMGGLAQKSIADTFPNNLTVEYCVCYEGAFSQFKVFESYAEMHYWYGRHFKGDGEFYDAVIPAYFDPEDFHTGPKGDYFLFLSRMTGRKGYEIAIEMTRQLGKKLIIAGAGGDRPKADHVEYIGYADKQKRAELLSGAIALLCPTIYIEPFGKVTVEALMSGTPVITTDWGAFPEIVKHGFNGWRCRTLEQFVWAGQNVDKLSTPHKIREKAMANYSLDRVRLMYQEYFSMLMTLWDKGWYSDNKERQQLDWLKKV